MLTVSFLKKIPMFKDMKAEDCRHLLEVISTRKLDKGCTLFQKGESGHTLYIIVSGKIKITLNTAEGEELIIAIFAEGDFFGEMSLLDDEPRSADATAIEETELLQLSREKFYSYLFKHNSALTALLTAMAKRLRRLDEFVTDYCFTKLHKRLAKKLLELSEKHGKKENSSLLLELQISQKDLGAMLGVTREAVNRELRLFREKGIITIKDKKIRINNLTGLLDIISST